MYCGGGLCGFLACRDEEKYVAEHPSLLISITETEREGEHGFGYCRFDRTSYHARERAKDWVGTATALWTIVGAVYMALMGPVGMKELGEAIVQKGHYAANLLSQIHGIRIPFSGFFKQFVVDFHATDMTVSSINRALLNRGIFGGKDIANEFPGLGKAALYSVTEMHTKQDLDKLANVLRDVVE
jgi:glycine dehydrogenase subunit 1